MHILLLTRHVGDAYPTPDASTTPEDIFFT